MGSFKKIFFLALTACVLGLTFSSCGKKEPKKEEKIVRLNLGTDPTSLYPQKIRNLPSIFTAGLIYEGLMRIDSDHKNPRCALAESYSISDEGKTYHFTLRKSMWSNGKSVKASDFVYAWKKALDPSFPCDYAFLLFSIKNGQKIKKGEASGDTLGVYALDENHLKIELENPVPYFLESLTYPVFFPVCEEADKTNPNWDGEVNNLIGCGPFVLTKWQPGSEMVFKKNTSYWDEKEVKLDQVHLYMVSDNTALQMFEKEELDWIGSPITTLPLEALPSLAKQNKILQKPFHGTYFLTFQMENPKMSHPKLRKALALSINRDQITNHAIYGQKATHSLVPSELFYETSSQNGLEENKQLAETLLEEYLQETGLTKNDLHLNYLYSNGDLRNPLIAQTLQEEWRKNLGIHVRVEGVEPKSFFARLAEGDFEMAAKSWIADVPDAINFLECFAEKNQKTNICRWQKDHFKELLKKASASSSLEERSLTLKEAEKEFLEDVPLVPIFHYQMLFLKKDRLKNVLLDNQGHIDITKAYLE